MGADGPGKAEIELAELARARVVVDEWEQASHNRDISRAVDAGSLGRGDIAELGRILAGEEAGRTSPAEITVFDSTGLAVQDLAVAALVYERYRTDPGAEAFAGVVEVDLAR
jgi:ornithine cyclodeaminase/alanine dehydrogenase-like protein (mu-crystallin family)